ASGGLQGSQDRPRRGDHPAHGHRQGPAAPCGGRHRRRLVKIAIVGAGATGGYLGARLARAGEPVTLVARGPHLAAMRAHGVRLIEADGEYTVHPACTDDLAVVGAADVVFLTVKAHGLPALAPRLGPLLG